MRKMLLGTAALTICFCALLAARQTAADWLLAKASILNHLAWTPPTLAGTGLFVRDRKTLASFELGK